MIKRLSIVWLVGMLAGVCEARAALHAFAYHDVRDVVSENVDADQYAVSTQNLIAHFSWLRANGYTPVSIDDVLAATAGRKPLPDKPVLLTFDDGLVSAYTHVFPLLKLFGYPAVFSLVTSWVENPQLVEYGNRRLDRAAFLSWAQIAEMQASGLAEFASHTHDLHRGVVANPQGNVQPAAVSMRFLGERYETAADYETRVAADLSQSLELLRTQLGAAPRIVTWPYGAFNDVLRDIAIDRGVAISLGLGVALNTRLDPLDIKREVVTGNPDLGTFAVSLLYPPEAPVVRGAQVDLDYVFDPDPEQQERNLGRLIDRVYALGISHVFLQAFADPDADGGADAVYFPNRVLPMRADLFNRAAWQLRTRANVSVYAWMPTLSFVGAAFTSSARVLQVKDGAIGPDPNSEPRLSPFDANARAQIAELYRDLARHASFDGLLFHDDGRLSDLEDASEPAMSAYRAQLGTDFTIERVASDPELAQRWARLKSRAIVEHTRALATIVRQYRPDVKTARNLFATALLDPLGEHYLAQHLDAYLDAYDHVALMAMPALEGVEHAGPFYTALVDAVSRKPEGLARTVFELQAFDWRSGRVIAGTELRDTMRWLQSLGVRHLAYYPEDFISGEPALEPLRQGISLTRFPGLRP